MILPKNVITGISRKDGIGWGIVEKDYFLTLLLDGISHEPLLKESLVFKGGTALRKIYFKNYRYSEDLDFTLKKALPGRELRSALDSAMEYLRREYNAEFRMRDFDSKPHFTDARIQFAGLNGGRNTIAVDFTADEAIVDEVGERPIINPYYEKKFSIKVYSLEEIAAEKLRSLLQRTRVRDYYDVWFLLTQKKKRLDTKKTRKIFLGKMAYKKLVFKGREQLLDREKLEQAQAYYATQLGNQMKRPLPPFEKIKKELEERIGAVISQSWQKSR